MIGDALGMIARRHRNNSAAPLIDRQCAEPVECAPFLECRGELEIFEFKPEVAAADLAQRPASAAIRNDDGTAKRGRGRLDIVRRDRCPTEVECEIHSV